MATKATRQPGGRLGTGNPAIKEIFENIKDQYIGHHGQQGMHRCQSRRYHQQTLFLPGQFQQAGDPRFLFAIHIFCAKLCSYVVFWLFSNRR